MHQASKSDIFSSPLPFKLSRAALAFILATVFLGTLLTLATLQDINRAEDLMAKFLMEKGDTIITAIEAGMQTSMMHYMGNGDVLQTLISESSRENDIVFIRIMNTAGIVQYQSAGAPKTTLSAAEVKQVLKSRAPFTHIEKGRGVFLISRSFRLRGFQTMMPMMMMGAQPPMTEPVAGIITVGLYTREFDLARHQDIEHTIFMGTMLFLIGSAGLYFLFLYQGMRVTETTLANIKLYTNNVLESIPVGVVTLDDKQRIVSYNRKMEEILGTTLENRQGQALSSVVPGCRIDWDSIRNTAVEQSAECQAGDGRKIPIRIGGSSIVNNDGQVIGTVLIIRDMSLIREMEEQLERTRRMAALGKMAAGIAHEIRNPLGTLRGFAHYFGNQPGATAESKGYAELMTGEVDRLNRSISSLLQFARPREPQFVPVDMDALMAKTAALMEADFAQHGVKFNACRQTGIVFEADPDLLLQVLMNLLKNSIQATASGGEISLEGFKDRHVVKIRVSDTGSGMSEQEKSRMFDPFYSTKKTGTGLGLAVSHQIIEQHRGVMEVDSTLGRGTAVTIILPAEARRK